MLKTKLLHKSIYAMLAIFVLAACKSDDSARAQFQIFQGAESVRSIDLHNDAGKQLSFEVALPYPDTSVLAFYRDYLTSDGWSECDPLGAWDTQLKTNENSLLAVRQHVNYFIKATSNQFLMLSLQYFSEPMKSGFENIQWIDNRQHITLVAYTVDDVSALVQNLAVSCPH